MRYRVQSSKFKLSLPFSYNQHTHAFDRLSRKWNKLSLFKNTFWSISVKEWESCTGLVIVGLQLHHLGLWIVSHTPCFKRKLCLLTKIHVTTYFCSTFARKDHLKVLTMISYFKFHFFPHLLIFLQFRYPLMY